MLTSSSDPVSTLEEIYESLYYILGISELGFAGIVLLIGVIGAIVSAITSAVVAVIIWIVEAYPVYRLAKKLDYKYAFLAWVPLGYFRLYVLSCMPGAQPVTFIDSRLTMKSRSMAFWLYLAINLFGSALITAIVGILSTVLPGIGSLSSVLYLVPSIICAIMEYVFLKDVLDIFKPDQKSNMIAAIVVTVLDSLVTFGFARAIYLYFLLKAEPITQRLYAKY